jgi:glycosyltransferase involved in cell wall biosynthesis
VPESAGAIAHYLTLRRAPVTNPTAPRQSLSVIRREAHLWPSRATHDAAPRLSWVTEAERDQLQPWVSGPLIRLVPNPVDVSEIDRHPARDRRTAVPQQPRPCDVPLVVFLGKITPRKRVDVLTRAFATLSRAHIW